jgi:hypothetical protein
VSDRPYYRQHDPDRRQTSENIVEELLSFLGELARKLRRVLARQELEPTHGRAVETPTGKKKPATNLKTYFVFPKHISHMMTKLP